MAFANTVRSLAMDAAITSFCASVLFTMAFAVDLVWVAKSSGELPAMAPFMASAMGLTVSGVEPGRYSAASEGSESTITILRTSCGYLSASMSVSRPPSEWPITIGCRLFAAMY